MIERNSLSGKKVACLSSDTEENSAYNGEVLLGTLYSKDSVMNKG